MPAYRSAACKAAENDCLEKEEHDQTVLPIAGSLQGRAGSNELFWSAWKMYPRPQERHRMASSFGAEQFSRCYCREHLAASVAQKQNEKEIDYKQEVEADM
jgi:hypothetical protein